MPVVPRRSSNQLFASSLKIAGAFAAIEYRLGIQLDEIGIALLISLFELEEAFFFVPARGVDLCNVVRKDVALGV